MASSWLFLKEYAPAPALTPSIRGPRIRPNADAARLAIPGVSGGSGEPGKGWFFGANDSSPKGTIRCGAGMGIGGSGGGVTFGAYALFAAFAASAAPFVNPSHSGGGGGLGAWEVCWTGTPRSLDSAAASCSAVGGFGGSRLLSHCS